MKLITAYVKRLKLSQVTLALHKVEGLTGMSASDVRGFGRGRARDAPDRIVEDLVDYRPSVRLEIACADDLVERVVEAIEKAAHTGLRGDGKIYVSPVERAVRIRTGERGEAAV